jgi:hypothetical protein
MVGRAIACSEYRERCLYQDKVALENPVAGCAGSTFPALLIDLGVALFALPEGAAIYQPRAMPWGRRSGNRMKLEL